MIRNILLILSVLFLSGPSLLLAAGKPSASEVLLLPGFCWEEYNPAIKNPGKEINNCGPGMNHYCSSVLEFNRSYSSRERFRRVQHLEVALRGVEYTLGWMKNYPNCSIRQDVLQTYTRVRSAFSGVGRPVPPDLYSGQWGDKAKPYSPGEISTKSGDGLSKETKTAVESKQEQVTKPAEQAVMSSPAVEENTSTGAATSSKTVQPTEPNKIGTPSNPYCRFCPPE